ncbi:MAG: class I SAM-dependent methyltransferase [Leptospiraceae bacterium]|nr:class I SAM-dependent methyltransferase [Leptospiraceae bacterium]MCP5498258.1 class I SAM-dependent methyltransferase [Leptospiraceae bacterium]
MLELLQTSEFLQDPETGIWTLKELKRFDYSDGDENENYLLEVLQNAKDKSIYSEELRKSIKDWPSLYHLSRRRSNLLRPFEEILKNKKILEIGCGCGAITRYIGELGAEVYSIEGSFRRAKSARERCKELSNVTIICGSSDKLPEYGEFDVVLLIGVLEYSPKFLGPEGPELLLKSIYRQLKPEGLLILAIENQLGLKYFAGYPEDHAGIPMYGINNSYTEGEFVTFGRKVLEDLLLDAGFDTLEQYIPLPDYKLPVSIVTPLGWQKYPDEMCSLALESVKEDAQRSPYSFLSLENAYIPVWKNGLAQDLANSFLFSCYKGEKSEFSNILAYYFSDARKIDYLKRLEFLEDEGVVIKAYHGNSSSIEEFIQGESYFKKLLNILNRPGWSIEEIVSWTKVWYDALLKELGLSENITLTAAVESKYWDATPFNAILDEKGDLCFFDLEWTGLKQIDLGLVLWHGLFISFIRVTDVSSPVQGQSLNVLEIIYRIMLYLGFDLSKESLLEYEKRDRQIISDLSGIDEPEEHILYVKNRCLRERILPEQAEQKLLQKEQELRQKEEELRQKEEELKAVYSSNSWKVTEPVRHIIKIIKK